MKSTLTLVTLVGCGLLAALPVSAQNSGTGTSLSRVRETFKAADADGSGAISAREAARARIPSKHFVAHDANADRSLSEDEFVAYYRGLLVSAKRAVGKELEAEVARIEALRRAKLAEQERQRLAAESRAAPVEPVERVEPLEPEVTEVVEAPVVAQATAEKLKSAQATMRRRTDSPPSSTAEKLKLAKEKLAGRWQGTGEPRAKVESAVEALEERARLAEAQPAPTEPAERQLDADRKDLIERARNAEQTAPVPAAPAPAAPLDRARAVLKRLVDEGRFTNGEARGIDALLVDRQATADAGGATPIADEETLRTTLRRAQAQVADQLAAGTITAEEARAMNDAFIVRARVISAKLPGQTKASEPVGPATLRQKTEGALSALEQRAANAGEAADREKLERAKAQVLERAENAAQTTNEPVTGPAVRKADPAPRARTEKARKPPAPAPKKAGGERTRKSPPPKKKDGARPAGRRDGGD